jgi:L-seryl-tRNA(Ser) seleniumtransferase
MASTLPADILRNIPSVTQLIETEALRELANRVGQSVVVARIRTVLDAARDEIRASGDGGGAPSTAELADRVARDVLEGERSSLRPVINATGILLHTGLGRSPLAEEAIEAMVEVARDYASVEIDLASGERSQRVVAVERLLCELTGAEAAVVANNNAGATMLTLAAVAAGREVVVSRGQLIEIGGSFRLPDVMRTSGATLCEVGTTNKTRLADYRDAIGPQTAALMRVHTSNYVVMGFTAEVTLDELVGLGRKHNLPVIDDIGSGAIVDFAPLGFSGEPVACESILKGADLVLFSGDKLLGGPQAGIVVGKKEWIARLAKHPMMRALRVDKLTLAALAATLKLYRDPGLAERRIPLLTLLRTPIDQLRRRAEQIVEAVRSVIIPQTGITRAEVIEDVAYLGGGSIPTQQLPTLCVALYGSGSAIDPLAARLRAGTPAVVGRVQHGRLMLDLRSVPARQDESLVHAVLAAAAK